MEGVVTRPRVHKGRVSGKGRGEVIHSGHFMISSVADQDELDDEVSHDRDSPVHHDQVIRLREGYDFSDFNQETQNTYQFGHRSTNQITIDASLSRLFECMSLAYRGGKVVSPKWKNFKGMRLTVKDKIRLNNAIWRTWHIQYIMKKKRNSISFVQFATPLDNESDCDSHSKPEAVVMEGKYWKRRIETVVAEYKKWRAFFMDKLQQSDRPGLTWVSSNQSMPPTPESMTGSIDAMMKADDMFDKLFRGLSQPFQFPNPREIAQHATNSDMMQPGLLQLQPPIDDFMDPLDLDIFCSSRRSPAHQSNISLFHSNNVNSSIAQLDFPTPMFTQQDLEIHEISDTQESSLEELVQRATSVHQENVVLSMANDVMRMQSERSLPPELSSTHAPLQHNRTIGVTDPVMATNVVPGTMNYPSMQNSTMSTTMPMMISKQQQNTPTISQLVMSMPHSYPQPQNMTPFVSNQAKRTMPPPQKVPPRRKSMSRTMNPGAAQQPVMQNQMTAPMYAAPTKLDSVQVQTGVPQHQVMQLQMQVDQPRQVIGGMQTMHSHHLGNERQLPIIEIKEGSVPTTPVLPPMGVQQQMLPGNHYTPMATDQPPTKKQHLVGHPNIVAKQSSQTAANPQLMSAKNQTLTQLLTTGRPDGKGASQLLQISQSLPMNQLQEAQLKQVAAQAAHFNTFQNSVVMAAARAAAAPSQPAGQTAIGRVSAPIATKTIAEVKENAVGQKRRPSIEIGKALNPPSPWIPSGALSMDTDDGKSGEDFAIEMEKKTYDMGAANTTTIGTEQGHFTAEQKRRCNIKALCDSLHDILPDLKASPNPKISKAILLTKSCNYIKWLQQSRTKTASEIQALKQRIDGLNEDISTFQQQLPANGAPVSQHRGERMKVVFDDWVREKTLSEWKFFIFSMIVRPWFLSYNETVSNASVDEFCRTSLTWLEKHCSMHVLRRNVVGSLQELGTTTSILTDPGNLQKQAESAVQQPPR